MVGIPAFEADDRGDRERRPIGLPWRHSWLMPQTARPTADILGDYLPAQARAVMLPAHHDRKVIRFAAAPRHCFGQRAPGKPPPLRHPGREHATIMRFDALTKLRSAQDHQLGRSVLINRARRAVTYVRATKGRRSLVDRERPLLIAASGPYVAQAFWMQTTGAHDDRTTLAASECCLWSCMPAVMCPCCCTSCCTDLGYGYAQVRTGTARKLRDHIRQIATLGFTVTKPGNALTRPAGIRPLPLRSRALPGMVRP